MGPGIALCQMPRPKESCRCSSVLMMDTNHHYSESPLGAKMEVYNPTIGSSIDLSLCSVCSCAKLRASVCCRPGTSLVYLESQTCFCLCQVCRGIQRQTKIHDGCFQDICHLFGEIQQEYKHKKKFLFAYLYNKYLLTCVPDSSQDAEDAGWVQLWQNSQPRGGDGHVHRQFQSSV